MSEFDSLMQKEISVSKNKCKIVDNYNWLLMCTVPEELKTEVGNKVKIATDYGKNISGDVVYISASDNGRRVVTISSDEDFSDIESERKINVTITFNEYKGYIIPVEAVHIYQNEEGVFIKNENKIEFRKAERIADYEGSEYVVINPSGNTELKTYDVVVVEGDLSEFYD